MSKQRIPGADPRHFEPIKVGLPLARDPIGSVLRQAFDPDETVPSDFLQLLTAIDAKTSRGGGNNSHS